MLKVPGVLAEASPAPLDPVFPTKALPKFLACLTSCESPVLVDLGPVIPSNVSFFCEQLGCKVFVEDICAEVERHVRQGRRDALPEFLRARFSRPAESVDGVLCWDVIDYLEKPAAQALAAELMRVLRPNGALLGSFGNLREGKTHYTKYIVADEAHLRHRAYAATCGRQASWPNRDIIRLFAGLRVSDSFLLKNNQREMLFRKPA
ncbi:MAG: hypothetical protein A3G76_14830 [Acidobacteria bacterium RIFCSPLOWO2_12_FULL_65_11]|nr:MAG: hypothetical protein A3H95_09135 [Acidobacteria bacterium RIFCSPLOWO2_02_FULL_64_15]OFW30990.1 MAG: hypothetical protein A3G76_14830 [Acidobacteria bacterium RIFCSPLOWO2_12_FULL_65_11]